MAISLTPRSDLGALAQRFAQGGAVSIPALLPPGQAAELARELAETQLWVEIFRAGEKVYEMPHAQFLALSPAQKDDLRRMVEDAARDGLQYRYRAIRVSEDAKERARRGLAIDRFADLLNAPETLDLLRAIVGTPAIGLADAQATDYRAGDFLTTHDDAIEGKNRVAAYVYSLTTGWQADWGGLLLLETGEAVSGFIPEFNTLRLFSVPTRHHVSYVAPWVTARRLSITGWLRGTGSGGPDQTGS
jgi:SM-20-related protein